MPEAWPTPDSALVSPSLWGWCQKWVSRQAGIASAGLFGFVRERGRTDWNVGKNEICPALSASWNQVKCWEGPTPTPSLPLKDREEISAISEGLIFYRKPMGLCDLGIRCRQPRASLTVWSLRAQVCLLLQCRHSAGIQAATPFPQSCQDTLGALLLSSLRIMKFEENSNVSK